MHVLCYKCHVGNKRTVDFKPRVDRQRKERKMSRRRNLSVHPLINIQSNSVIFKMTVLKGKVSEQQMKRMTYPHCAELLGV